MYSRLWSFFLLRGRYGGPDSLIGRAVVLLTAVALVGCYQQQRRDEIHAHLEKDERVREPASMDSEGSPAEKSLSGKSVSSKDSADSKGSVADLPVVVLQPKNAKSAAPSPNESAPPTGLPVLSRAEVMEAVAAGPGRMLGYVRVRPYSMKRRFLGFQILELLSPDLRFQYPYLRRGDVILQINGIRMKQPENLFTALQSLRTAKTLEFDIWRDGKRVIVGYRIEGEGAVPPAAKSARPK